MYEDREPVFDAADKSYIDDNDFVNYRVNEANKRLNLVSCDKEINYKESPEVHKPKSSKMNTKLYKKQLQYNLPDRISEEKDFIIYEISDPELWYSAQAQLFEKLSTPEGKTVWNDLTKDETACVNSVNPEWSNQDVDIQYKSADFLAREDYRLPRPDLCLVVPIKQDHENGTKVYNLYENTDTIGEFMIVPVDDVITLEDPKDINKRDENSNLSSAPKGANDQRRRQVIVRSARALIGVTADNLKIVSRGSDRYLKLPHKKPHYAQIDLEARADDNQLILVGVLGRLTTIVSDTTRRSRSMLTVQATNTGLAAARMRVLTRGCRPELLDSNSDQDETRAVPVILPPKHTRTFRLKLPLPIPIESANCTIVLLNDDDKSIALRDVRIKRDDRCFCVWHCDCVCLGEDPKLLCRDMSAAQLLAAGLSAQQKSRHARSVCYPDIVTLNLFVTFIGVLIALLILGLLKALLGLACRCVATWGLHRFLETPRKLDHYYERSLRNRRVLYDDEGWPIHPDTKERTVGLVSEPMEFILNVIFFVTLPCLMLWDAMRKLCRCQRLDGNSELNYKMDEDVKRCFSSHDVQVTKRQLRRRRRELHRWMTPQAEELTAGIWQKGLSTLGEKTRVYLPLLQDKSGFRKTCEHSSYIDSEQDDTEYVLMQMQKSRESLARSQQQLETKTCKEITNVDDVNR
ncbi:uncharacterized protein LOC120623533 [Pararge aegeria]|uniref:uncharacterized protein LOC120623533 n=1 Tax=Pararge aegeria TaxID=116150 RepID=UPI0019D31BC8|nr:uncharacterized protein LOC120623533 [Pararge aegeria]